MALCNTQVVYSKDAHINIIMPFKLLYAMYVMAYITHYIDFCIIITITILRILTRIMCGRASEKRTPRSRRN